ncbi:MAG: PTS sugar transporter subunit IIC [Elusimicrobia bacterium]|nr:PTS sugar transporter subunit IIC [Elusimicrobiota bacterium]
MIGPVLGCAALAVLELDAALVAQTLVSRPLVVGAAFGAMSGEPWLGALLGGTFELLGLADLPVGGHISWSAPTAAGVAALLAGQDVSLSLCLAGGLAAGLLHCRLELMERARRAATADALASAALAGERTVGAALLASLAGHAAMTFVVSLSVVAATALIERHVWWRAPEFARHGAAWVAMSAPWIGLSNAAVWGFKRA